ncbi:MAG: tRNA 2-thiouridine(34) synthase MnmA [Armatimonadota bacterium]
MRSERKSPGRPGTQEPNALAALSGGVDSAVAALIAIDAGFRPIGVTLLFPGVSAEPARDVCRTLGIAHRVIEAREAFERCVVREFIHDWARGLTPNPCVECNPRIKFDLLLAEADALGCRTIVSGHYARVHATGDQWHLLRGADRSRDQSYMLHRMPQAVLERLMLPLGELSKQEVRALASKAHLSAADRPDSQDVCFAPEGDFTALIGEARPEALEPGPILDEHGRELGRHRGLVNYTVGQRRGLGIGGPEGPYFVLRIDPARNAIIAGAEEDLWVERTEVERLHLIGDVPEGEFEATVMTRYRGAETSATVVPEGDGAIIRFHSPHRAPAPGQSAVFYDGERCLGGGVIMCGGGPLV